MEGSSKSPENDVIFDLESELSPDFPIREEMIEEVMRELYKEITSPTSTCTETAESPSSGSSFPSPFFVNSGKSESCGASVSDSTSSVMAGVEFAGGGLFGKTVTGGESVEEEGMFLWERSMMDGFDGVGFGDEWLEKVMGWAPLEVAGWS